MKNKHKQIKPNTGHAKRTFQRGDDTNPEYSLFSSNVLLIFPIPDIISNRLTYLSNCRFPLVLILFCYM